MFLTSDSRDFQVVDLGEATALVAELEERGIDVSMS
jgi:hypothetical protein